MTEDQLADVFQAHRSHLRAVGYRMLGSMSEADDAVQETWLRFSRHGSGGIDNIKAWLTTVMARLCLNVLRSRRALREEPLDCHVPDPILTREESGSPEELAILADSVGLALLVVLEHLSPSERLAFVLHDTFAVPFDEIAAIIGKSPDATRQLASRARRRVQGATPAHETDISRQRRVVDAFVAASREGDFEGLLAVLDPDIVLRADSGESGSPASRVINGARAVAANALSFARYASSAQRVLVNGTPGVITAPGGALFAVLAFTVYDGRITRIDILADPARLARLRVA
jgi:RNA polymerase sigma-70 factor (ECF subfamily)